MMSFVSHIENRKRILVDKAIQNILFLLQLPKVTEAFLKRQNLGKDRGKSMDDREIN